MPQEKPKKTAVRDSIPLSKSPKFVPTGDGDSVLVRGTGYSSSSMRPAKDWNSDADYRKKYSKAAQHANKKMGERARKSALNRHYKATGSKPIIQTAKEKYNRLGGSFTNDM